MLGFLDTRLIALLLLLTTSLASAADTVDVPALMAEGKAQIGESKFKEAKATFQKIIAVNRDDVEALLGLGLASRGLGEKPAARTVLDRAYQLKAGRNDRRIVLNAVAANLDTSNELRAAKIAYEYLKANPQPVDEQVFDALGTALFQVQGKDRNDAVFSQATKFYESYESDVNATRPGMKRWGDEWMSRADAESNRRRLDSAQAKVRDAQLDADREKENAEAIKHRLDETIRQNRFREYKVNTDYLEDELREAVSAYKLAASRVAKLEKNCRYPRFRRNIAPAGYADTKATGWPDADKADKEVDDGEANEPRETKDDRAIDPDENEPKPNSKPNTKPKPDPRSQTGPKDPPTVTVPPNRESAPEDPAKVMNGAKRIAFVIDCSKGMEAKLVEIKRDLRKRIYKLPEGKTFNIYLASSDGIQVLSTSPVDTSDDGKSRADEFLDNVKTAGRCVVPFAIKNAVEAGAEQVWVLTSGETTDLAALRDQVRQLKVQDRARLYTVESLAGDNVDQKRLLWFIANENGGMCVDPSGNPAEKPSSASGSDIFDD